MKFVSFNINGIRARLHQLQALIDVHQPDVIGLQEIKVDDPQFPLEAVQAMGYHVEHHGQKGHYGVALLTKQPPKNVQKGWLTDDEDAQKRMIMVTIDDDDGSPIRILNGYFPQGENRSHETKFPAKQKFYADLMSHLDSHHSPDDKLVVMGDINISPTDLDIGIGEANAKRWLKTGKCSFLPEEREWLDKLVSWGLTDSFRYLNPEICDRYSWFDYRSKGFNDNRGLRIDVILTTKSLSERLLESDVDYDLRGIEKPSDHAPIWTTISSKT
ncbi:exodeoxyribonuclease III [Ferrimonas sp. SCSIO 43195]|uniref:exodeoxyribonuclease III n=1 Tax=Ferrimonas sp. SCSIO 43195 TaxID=2822844 RepID=UPI002074D410|nr:exodeoxyribonuclease III [Ferrimonas sp. SCSIO 43195]USD36519.1 exodeoxyribonuclease III [Ferrimonas sp. SCSIO 43195]